MVMFEPRKVQVALPIIVANSWFRDAGVGCRLECQRRKSESLSMLAFLDCIQIIILHLRCFKVKLDHVLCPLLKHM